MFVHCGVLAPAFVTGHKSNRDAIGAGVKLVTAHGTQYATVSTTSSYLSVSYKRVHFWGRTRQAALRYIGRAGWCKR